MPAGESFGAILLFLGPQDVGGAAIADEQVFAILGIEQAPERLDPAHDHQKIVLARQGEDGVDEIVPRALVAQIDFQAIGEEGEEARATSLSDGASNDLSISATFPYARDTMLVPCSRTPILQEHHVESAPRLRSIAPTRL